MSMTEAQVEAIVSRIETALTSRGAPTSAHTGPTTASSTGQNAAALADYQRLLGEQAQRDALINQTPPRLRELTEHQCKGCGESLFLEPGYYHVDEEQGLAYWTVKMVINHAEKCPVALAEAVAAAADDL